MKKRIATVATIVLLALTIIALYLYIDKQSPEKPKELSVAQKLLEKNLEKNYPPTPNAVAELYCEIVSAKYNETTKDEEVEKLVAFERQLFDKEFADANPEDRYLASTKEELKAAKEKKLLFTGYSVDRSSNVKQWKENDGKSYASLTISFSLRNKEGTGVSERTLVMRKDDQNRFKILGWKILTEESAE